MLERLSEGLRGAIRKIARSGYITEEVLREVIRDLQRALIQADVPVKLVLRLAENIRKRAKEEKPLPGVTEREHLTKIIFEELVSLVGGEYEVELKPSRILLVGLYGSGKTTTAAKLALMYRKKGLRTCLIGCDVHRPAAMNQLKQLAEKIGVSCHTGDGPPEKIAEEGLSRFSKFEVVIVDSAGRNALDRELASELKGLYETVRPDEVYLVIPADMGQAAGTQAREFSRTVPVSGVILTKMDATAKGGGAVSACAETGARIKFVGTGEKLEDLELFNPKRFVSRLLGYGDLEGLLEKIKEVESEDRLKEKAEKIMSGKFTLTDFYEQIKSIQSMGSLRSVLDRIPGLGGKLGKIDIETEEEKMKKWAYAIQSMTPEERENPEIINSSRIKRISRGSGVPEPLIRELLRNYRQAKKLLKSASRRRFRLPF